MRGMDYRVMMYWQALVQANVCALSLSLSLIDFKGLQEAQSQDLAHNLIHSSLFFFHMTCSVVVFFAFLFSWGCV